MDDEKEQKDESNQYIVLNWKGAFLLDLVDDWDLVEEIVLAFGQILAVVPYYIWYQPKNTKYQPQDNQNNHTAQHKPKK